MAQALQGPEMPRARGAVYNKPCIGTSPEISLPPSCKKVNDNPNTQSVGISLVIFSGLEHLNVAYCRTQYMVHTVLVAWDPWHLAGRHVGSLVCLVSQLGAPLKKRQQ